MDPEDTDYFDYHPLMVTKEYVGGTITLMGAVQVPNALVIGGINPLQRMFILKNYVAIMSS